MEKQILLIGIVGHARAGKDTAVDGYFRFTKCPLPAFRVAIADSIRKVAYSIGFSKDQCTTADLKQQKDEMLGISPRQAMQGIGSAFRAEFGEDIWLKILEKKIHEICVYPRSIVFVTDIRMPIEAEMIKKYNGVLLKIDNPKLDLTQPMYQHETEIHIDEITGDYNFCNTMDNSLGSYKRCIAQYIYEKIVEPRIAI